MAYICEVATFRRPGDQFNASLTYGKYLNGENATQIDEDEFSATRWITGDTFGNFILFPSNDCTDGSEICRISVCNFSISAIAVSPTGYPSKLLRVFTLFD